MDIKKRLLNTLFLCLIAASSAIYAKSDLPNLSTRASAEPKTVTTSLSFLYLQPSETVDWAFTTSTKPNKFKTAYKTFSFDWAPGYRIGLGYNMLHDHWDTKASYTWFQSKAKSKTKGAVTSAFLGGRLSLLEPFETGKGSLNMTFNMFDWDLGRSFLISEHFIVRPLIGARGGWINQTIHSYWTKRRFLDLFFISARENIKHRFKGIGPKGGFHSKWCFGDIQKATFSIIGEVETSYLWGHWSIEDKYFDNLSTQISIRTANRNFGAFVLRSFLGLRWDANFNCDTYHFSSKLGLDIENFFDQFQIFSNTSGSQNNNLILQGLSASARLDF